MAPEKFASRVFAQFELFEQRRFVQKEAVKVVLHDRPDISVGGKFHEIHQVERQKAITERLVGPMDGQKRVRDFAKNAAPFDVKIIVADGREVRKTVKTGSHFVEFVLAAHEALDTSGVTERRNHFETNALPPAAFDLIKFLARRVSDLGERRGRDHLFGVERLPVRRHELEAPERRQIPMLIAEHERKAIVKLSLVLQNELFLEQKAIVRPPND